MTHQPQGPLVIEACGNEFASPVDNPHVRVGADAIIRDALDCATAGAATCHWHALGEDGVDRPDDLRLGARGPDSCRWAAEASDLRRGRRGSPGRPQLMGGGEKRRSAA